MEKNTKLLWCNAANVGQKAMFESGIGDVTIVFNDGSKIMYWSHFLQTVVFQTAFTKFGEGIDKTFDMSSFGIHYCKQLLAHLYYSSCFDLIDETNIEQLLDLLTVVSFHGVDYYVSTIIKKIKQSMDSGLQDPETMHDLIMHSNIEHSIKQDLEKTIFIQMDRKKPILAYYLEQCETKPTPLCMSILNSFKGTKISIRTPLNGSNQKITAVIEIDGMVATSNNCRCFSAFPFLQNFLVRSAQWTYKPHALFSNLLDVITRTPLIISFRNENSLSGSIDIYVYHFNFTPTSDYSAEQMNITAIETDKPTEATTPMTAIDSDDEIQMLRFGVYD